MDFFETPCGSAGIIYEDGDVIVFEKPEGILSQGAGGEKSILDCISEYTGREAYPIHRLDRNTGGVMLAAKTKASAAVLSELVTEGAMKKEYLAVVNGIPEEGEGTLEDDLFFDRRRDKSFVVKKGGRRGVKHAVLDYTVVSESNDVCGRSAALLRILLHTGRTHQIRVQMANFGHPLMGDGKYGGGNCRYGCVLYSHRITVDRAALMRTSLKKSSMVRLMSEDGTVSFELSPRGGIWDCFSEWNKIRK